MIVSNDQGGKKAIIMAAVYSLFFTDLSIESITSQRHRDHNKVRNNVDELLQFDAIKLQQIRTLHVSEYHDYTCYVFQWFFDN
jgi:N6-adenosine-specific RNA methylase IME4